MIIKMAVSRQEVGAIRRVLGANTSGNGYLATDGDLAEEVWRRILTRARLRQLKRKARRRL